jgi:hypothetical protein
LDIRGCEYLLVAVDDLVDQWNPFFTGRIPARQPVFLLDQAMPTQSFATRFAKTDGGFARMVVAIHTVACPSRLP